VNSPITVITPVSPIPSNPETKILEETLDSVRHHLPDSEIILTFDGVRSEQEDMRGDYEEFTRRALWVADKHYGNICPFVFDHHLHQTGMMRAVLHEIRTPLLMYVEQDTPLCVDREIDFTLINQFIEANYSDVVRLHHEAVIPDEHQPMMHGMEPGFPFMRTSQWSQRPHVAWTDFYRYAMQHFTPGARSFIEDKMHGICDEAYKIHGMAGWEDYRVHIYAPEGDIKRSWHTDGRAGGPKFETEQVF
jgi:hypothetical protein